jgi:hypothetical protein
MSTGNVVNTDSHGSWLCVMTYSFGNVYEYNTKPNWLFTCSIFRCDGCCIVGTNLMLLKCLPHCLLVFYLWKTSAPQNVSVSCRTQTRNCILLLLVLPHDHYDYSLTEFLLFASLTLPPVSPRVGQA